MEISRQRGGYAEQRTRFVRRLTLRRVFYHDDPSAQLDPGITQIDDKAIAAMGLDRIDHDHFANPQPEYTGEFETHCDRYTQSRHRGDGLCPLGGLRFAEPGRTTSGRVKNTSRLNMPLPLGFDQKPDRGDIGIVESGLLWVRRARIG